MRPDLLSTRLRWGVLAVLGSAALLGVGVHSHNPFHAGHATPFRHTLVVYGRHTLTPAQVIALERAASGRALPVISFELPLASGVPAFPTIPVAAVVVDPEAYGKTAAAPELTDQLARGVVLAKTEARLRHASVGSQLHLVGGRTLQVAGVVDDSVLGGYELAATAAQIPPPAGASYLLVPDSVDQRALRRATPEIGLRIVARTRNGFVSDDDTVLTQLQLKSRFGEFSTGTVDGRLRLDRKWISDWLASASLPQLGVVTCNRLVLPALRAAMVEVTQRGLGSTIDTADFRREGGCWSPRVVRLGDGGRISSHAWGVAVDINGDANVLGQAPHQDPRLVAIMRAHGFVWGGDFLRPDGEHFEWVGTYS